MLDNKLIENALALCEYMYDDFMDEIYRWDSYSFSWEYCWPKIEQKFSIEKFCYYLLSPEFIEKYADRINWDFFFEWQYERVAMNFWQAIYEYQDWLETTLIELLYKLWAK